MWSRGILGVLCLITGVIWVAQGTNTLHGSGMSGHGAWTLWGVVMIAIGVALIARAWRVRNRAKP